MLVVLCEGPDKEKTHCSLRWEIEKRDKMLIVSWHMEKLSWEEAKKRRWLWGLILSSSMPTGYANFETHATTLIHHILKDWEALERIKSSTWYLCTKGMAISILQKN
jgi:hypothetical protein